MGQPFSAPEFSSEHVLVEAGQGEGASSRSASSARGDPPFAVGVLAPPGADQGKGLFRRCKIGAPARSPVPGHRRNRRAPQRRAEPDKIAVDPQQTALARAGLLARARHQVRSRGDPRSDGTQAEHPRERSGTDPAITPVAPGRPPPVRSRRTGRPRAQPGAAPIAERPSFCATRDAKLSIPSRQLAIAMPSTCFTAGLCEYAQITTCAPVAAALRACHRSNRSPKVIGALAAAMTASSGLRAGRGVPKHRLGLCSSRRTAASARLPRTVAKCACRMRPLR